MRSDPRTFPGVFFVSRFLRGLYLVSAVLWLAILIIYFSGDGKADASVFFPFAVIQLVLINVVNYIMERRS